MHLSYICSVDIHLPLKQTLELWENEELFKEWQDGFQSIEIISGEANVKGTKSRIILEDQRKMELIETILEYNLPDEKLALYEHEHMVNTQSSRFSAIDEDHTRYTSEVNYIKFNGLLIKIIFRLFPGKLKAQSQKWMDQFKAFAESRK